MSLFALILYKYQILDRAVGGSQNLGGQYCLTYFGQYNPTPQILTPIKIRKMFWKFIRIHYGFPNIFHQFFEGNIKTSDLSRFPQKN